MSKLTNEFLKDMAVTVASDFLADNVSLSQGVATMAASENLNTDQVQRLIEVTNQLTYLKMLSSAKDRTFEFPVASFDEVAEILTRKTDELSEDLVDPVVLITEEAEPLVEKIASESQEDDLNRIPDNEKRAYLNRLYYSAQRDLTKLADREVTLLEELTQAVASCKNEENFMSKVAQVTDGDDKHLTKIARLVFGEVPEYSEDELFYASDLANAERVSELLKEAEELVVSRKELEKTLEKTSAAIPTFVNTAREFTKSKIADPAKAAGGRLSDLGGKGLKALEPGIYTAEASPNRDIWKSLQGRRGPRF